MKKYYFVIYNIFVWKIEKVTNTIFQRMLVFFFCLFCFLLLSNNTLHVMFHTYLCYWNKFQYKYITEITFHVQKQFHAWVTSKGICLLVIILLISLFRFCIDFVLFNEALLPSFSRTLGHFLTFLLFAFLEK